ncbi:hypothetical protein JQX13_50455 [Archangium violaceum]|uniref:hypothetical protein n=1 Tax=Archangium violaceum TaxID=83451 RepID=UPI00193B19E5|nr:hypothetical protein [Archangium violaceum]QRK08089.1 hypothetical protein JQX13_50455 [Archangium violaceum]
MRRARPEAARTLAVAAVSPPVAEVQDETNLLPFESGPPAPGEDLPSQLRGAFQAALGAPYRWDMRRDERAVNELLAAAGADGPAEVLRRWRIGLANQGFPRVRSLADLVKRWNDCAQSADSGAKASPSRASDGVSQGSSGVCEACGRAGQGAEYGGGTQGRVWLGYQCNCSATWTALVEQGRPYTEAAAWARERRARGAP